MANTEGLQKTLEYIQEHPSEWDQMRWSSCFAGISLRVLRDAQLSDSGCCNLDRELMLDGKAFPSWEIMLTAQEVLELTDEQRNALFHQTNSLTALTALVAEFTAEKAPA